MVMAVLAIVVVVVVAGIVLAARRRRRRRLAWRPSDMGTALARAREKQRRRG